MSLERVIWSWCLAFPMGIITAQGCGGQLKSEGCKPGWQLCHAAVVCCPDYTLCGDGTNGCGLGYCCSGGPTDSGTDATDGYVDPSQSFDADYGAQPALPSVPGGGGGGGVGSPAPAPTRM